MPSAALTTVNTMLEALPPELQDRVVDHLRQYLEELRDELEWDQSFQRTEGGLAAAARRARQEVAAGRLGT